MTAFERMISAIVKSNADRFVVRSVDTRNVMKMHYENIIGAKATFYCSSSHSFTSHTVLSVQLIFDENCEFVKECVREFRFLSTANVNDSMSAFLLPVSLRWTRFRGEDDYLLRLANWMFRRSFESLDELKLEISLKGVAGELLI